MTRLWGGGSQEEEQQTTKKPKGGGVMGEASSLKEIIMYVAGEKTEILSLQLSLN